MGACFSSGAAALTALLVFGCGAETDAPDPDAWVSVGAGDEHYAGLTDGDSVQIVLGPQGGYMIALALRAGSVEPGDDGDPSDPENPRITFRALRASDDSVLGVITQQRGLSPTAESTYESYGTWLIFNPAIPTESYFDTEIVVEVALVDARGAEPNDSVTVTAIAPEIATSLDLDVEPGEVVGGADDDAEHAAAEVGDAHQQRVAGLRRDRGFAADEAALERHVAHVAGVGVIR